LREGGRTALIGFPKSIEELFGKRRNNEAIMAILFAKLPLSKVDFDETGVVKRSKPKNQQGKKIANNGIL
jgi:hypothetical protein